PRRSACPSARSRPPRRAGAPLSGSVAAARRLQAAGRRSRAEPENEEASATGFRRSPSGTSGRELGQERVRAPLGAETRDAHVAGIDRRVLRKRLDQGPDRAEQSVPIAAG